MHLHEKRLAAILADHQEYEARLAARPRKAGSIQPTPMTPISTDLPIADIYVDGNGHDIVEWTTDKPLGMSISQFRAGVLATVDSEGTCYVDDKSGDSYASRDYGTLIVWDIDDLPDGLCVEHPSDLPTKGRLNPRIAGKHLA